MEQIVSAHFDGKVIVPDEPVELPVGQRLHVQVTIAGADRPQFADLLQFATDVPDAPPDLAAEHDYYLYGTPKRNQRFIQPHVD
jgi:hypothetical protein